MTLVTRDDIAAAERRLAGGRIVRTPLLPCRRLSEEHGGEILLKAENLQLTGSFKVRGAMNALRARMTRGEQGTSPGVVAFSAGNHGAAVALAAAELGVRATVCMPPRAVAAKVAAVRRLGGEVVFTDDLLGTCRQVAADRGYQVLQPFDDLDVIAGQGTVGTEILTDCPGPGLVLVPVGGGGLISGVAAAIRPAAPTARLVGVEPHTAATLTHALRVGAPASLPDRPESLADGLTAPFAGEHTLPHVQRLVDEVVTVSEEDIARAWHELLDASKLLVEPSAAVTLAALRTGRVAPHPSAPTVLVLSGGNTDPSTLATLAAPPAPNP